MEYTFMEGKEKNGELNDFPSVRVQDISLKDVKKVVEYLITLFLRFFKDSAIFKNKLEKSSLLDVKEAADYLRVSKSFIYQRTGEDAIRDASSTVDNDHSKKILIDHVKLDGKILRFRYEDLDKYIERFAVRCENV